MAFRDDVDTILRRRCQGSGNGDVCADVTHDGMDRRVDAKRFADDGVEDGERFEFFVFGGAKRSIVIRKMLDLFLVKRITIVEGREL